MHTRIRWGGTAACGPIRYINEDRWLAVPIVGWGGLFIVADGAGAMTSAAEHTDLVVTELARRYQQLPPEERLEAAATLAVFQATNRVLGDYNDRLVTTGSGCTLALALVHGHQARITWLGDCRVWLHREGALRALTTEHTLVQKMIAMGRITAEQARTHPHRSILLRTMLGTTGHDHSIPETVLIDLLPGDRLVLATDGCWRPLSEAAVCQTLRTPHCQRAAEQLIQLAHEQDGSDNAAALVVRIL